MILSTGIVSQERSGHTATIEWLPWQKLAVTNEIHTLHRLHLLSWSSSYVMYLANVSILWSTCMIRSRESAGGQGRSNHHWKCLEIALNKLRCGWWSKQWAKLFSVTVLRRTVNTVTTNQDTRVSPKAIHEFKEDTLLAIHDQLFIHVSVGAMVSAGVVCVLLDISQLSRECLQR